ncbi:MAG: hypothetical protein IT443_11170 [Phycisphaeraceae bacterium]|nr:hypothetical protein [Phycisphaeraceae bacterium]
MPHARTLGAKLRWVLLVGGLLCWLGGMFYLFNCLWPEWRILPLGDPSKGWGLLGVMGIYPDSEWKYLWSTAAYLGVFLVTQWLFLGPGRAWKPGLAEEARPLRRSLVAGSFMAGVISIALLATVLHLLGWWRWVLAPETFWEPFLSGSSEKESVEEIRHWPLVLALVLAWGVWLIVFTAYSRQISHQTFVSKVLRGLIGGSVLETLVAAPAQALVRNPDDCYCMRGSYTGLILGLTALFWTFGPGIALLFIREKNRLRKLAPPPN